MPVYGGKCDTCGKNYDYNVSIKCRNDSSTCPHCGASGNRDVEYELNTMSDFNETCKDHERWSWSMGVNRQDIPEMTRKYPGSEYHPITGQLKIKNRNHKLRELKRRDMVEYS